MQIKLINNNTIWRLGIEMLHDQQVCTEITVWVRLLIQVDIPLAPVTD